MFLISELMGISFGQADLYRRALEKPHKDKKGYVKNFNENVVEIAKKRGFDPKITEAVRKDIIENSGYAFNKCLAGSEKIFKTKEQNFYPTIEEMFKIKNDKDYAESIGQIDLHEEYQLSYGQAFSMDKNGRLMKNNIIDITFSGKKQVYLVKTENQSTVKCTMNHKFPTPNGKKILEDLKIGDELYVNDEYLAITSKIESIEYIGEENTYNVEMQAPNHNLLMENGIIVSNSHAVAYSIISYWTAWIKTNYPLVFYCNMMNGDIGQLAEFMQAAENSGITIKPPHVNYSKYEAIIEDKDNKVIRIGLNAIKGVGPAAVESIIQHQPYNSIEEFFELNNLRSVNKKVIEALINIGAFNETGIKVEIEDISNEYLDKFKFTYENGSQYLCLNRNQLALWYTKYNEIIATKTVNKYVVPRNMIKGKFLDKYELAFEKDDTIVIPEDKLDLFELKVSDVEQFKNNRKKSSAFLNLDDDENNFKKANNFRKPIIKYYKEISDVKENKLHSYVKEIDDLGFSFVPHPLQHCANSIKKLNDIEDGDSIIIGGIITEMVERLTKTNKKFYWVMIKTPHETVRMTLWDNQFKQHHNIIKLYNVIKVKGIKGYGGISCEKIAQVNI